MLALIPARGGSKGLPNKNIRPLNGKPLIEYTIEAALEAPSISTVVVSTDSVDIAAVAKKAGAEVPFLRPKSLATDDALAIDVYIHALEFLESLGSDKIDELVILLPTCPLRDHNDIEGAINLYKNNKTDSVVSFVEESHPIYWHAWKRKDNKIDFIFDHGNRNRQNLRKSIYPNGAIYIIKSKLLKERKYYNDDSLTYIMNREKSIDIDTAFDFRLAEIIINQTNNEKCSDT